MWKLKLPAPRRNYSIRLHRPYIYLALHPPFVHILFNFPLFAGEVSPIANSDPFDLSVIKTSAIALSPSLPITARGLFRVSLSAKSSSWILLSSFDSGAQSLHY